MGMFSGIENAKVGAGGVYFLANKGPSHSDKTPQWQPAFYKVQIKRLITMTSRKKDDLFIVEALILESDCPERKAGMVASWVVNLSLDAALGNIKGFIAASMGMDPTDEATVDREVTEEVCELAVSDSQPLVGAELLLECTMITTKQGNPFTLHRWSPVTEAA